MPDQQLFAELRRRIAEVEETCGAALRDVQVAMSTYGVLQQSASDAKQILDYRAASLDEVDRLFAATQTAFADFRRRALARRREQDTARTTSGELAERGWHLDPQMHAATPKRLAHLLSGSPESADEVLIDYFRQRCDAIERELEESFPRRKHLLHSAFEAHRQGKFNLSVPVFLIQADGIWWDRFSRTLSIHRDRRAIAKEAISQLGDEYVQPIAKLLFIDLLNNSIPIYKSENQRNKAFQELNRHQVLHGEVVDYGTEKNSLKAVSLLNFLRFVLEGG